MRIGLAGGGTGGHVYPVIAVAARLRAQQAERGESLELLYYGTAKGVEYGIAQSEGIPFRAVPAAQVRVRKPWLMARGLFQLWNGTRIARRMIEQDRPDAIFATGGYAAAPIGRAAKQAGVPLIVFLPDAHPGWAVRFLARYAAKVACSVEQSVSELPVGRTVVTGYPVREQFLGATREEGIARFNLDPTLKTVLVAGGSLGAHQINLAVAGMLRTLLEQAQVIHISGADEDHWLQRERDRLPEWLRSRYHLHAYTDDMACAMRAADLAVMRAGASTLGELPVCGLPAIVIPGTFSDQHLNAAYLAATGATVTLLTPRLDELGPLITGLLEDAARREAMATAMRALAQPEAAERLATLLREVAA